MTGVQTCALPISVVTRAELYEHLFDENEDTLSNLLEVHVCNLRRKLGAELIKTRRGLGYVIEGAPEGKGRP